MIELTSDLLGRACRIFLNRAYPGGRESILPNKCVYLDIKPEDPIELYLPPAAAALGIGQRIPGATVGSPGYDFRLGCEHYRNLKLRVQSMEVRGQPVWVFSVNTHDAFSPASPLPPADHPDAADWHALQRKNASLKVDIEVAFEAAGLTTFKGLLKQDLICEA